MKILIPSLFLLFSASSFALENGSYTNKNIKAESPDMFKSVTLNSSACKSGGFMLKFYGADPMNFCAGYDNTVVQKYKKCVGKEVSQYPLKVCLGISVPSEIITSAKTSGSAQSGEIVLTQTYTVANELISKQTYTLKDVGANEISITQNLIVNKTGGKLGEDVYFFSK